MGYALVYGACFLCNNLLSFNPQRVPSIRDSQGERQPICETCIQKINAERQKAGMPKIEYAADAYTFCDEAEL